ncbi:unnamed protein product [Mucor hiemalis]
MDSKLYDIYRGQGYSPDAIYDLMNQDRSSAQAGRRFNERLSMGKNIEGIIDSFGPILLMDINLIPRSIIRLSNLIEDLIESLEGTDICQTMKDYPIPVEIKNFFNSLDKYLLRKKLSTPLSSTQ